MICPVCNGKWVLPCVVFPGLLGAMLAVTPGNTACWGKHCNTPQVYNKTQHKIQQNTTPETEFRESGITETMIPEYYIFKKSI